jgi:sugar phosphate isomerase/epimerase
VNSVKLAVSNIAWEPKELETHLTLLKNLECEGVEIAPSCIWPEPVNTSEVERKRLERLIKDYGLELVGFHALLYNHPELKIFDSTETLKETASYMQELIHLCRDLGGRVMVFGSPRNRERKFRTQEECLSIANDFFHFLATEAEKYNVFICIEPLYQNCDFITSSLEGLSMVNQVNHPNFRLHLDIRAMQEAGEDFYRVFSMCAEVLEHIHVGDSNLSPPGYDGFNHRAIATALRKSGYNKYVSIEMRQGFGPSQKVVEESVRYIKSCYVQ